MIHDNNLQALRKHLLTSVKIYKYPIPQHECLQGLSIRDYHHFWQLVAVLGFLRWLGGSPLDRCNSPCESQKLSPFLIPVLGTAPSSQLFQPPSDQPGPFQVLPHDDERSRGLPHHQARCTSDAAVLVLAPGTGEGVLVCPWISAMGRSDIVDELPSDGW